MLKRFLVLVIFLLSYAQAIGQSVDTAWVRRYDGPGNGGDEARAIAVDGSGNVYVTGLSTGIGTNYDYATIKHHSNGDTAWVRRYNGTGNGPDYAYAIAVDDSGNVYVTGTSIGSGTGYDYTTIKYYSNGDTAWVRRYNGPGNGDDAAYAIAVDGSGNVYVTGTRSRTGRDYATIKYHSNGDTAWVRSYNGTGYGADYAYAIAVDDSGYVYVTGQSSGDGTRYDYATIKYYSNGDTAWVRRYNGPRDSSDCATAIAVDGSGNLYVTGRSDASGTGIDYATIKYYPTGDTAWVRRYNGPGNFEDVAYAITVNGSGSVYVTGVSAGAFYDYATIKYYSNGDTAWVRRYNGYGYGHDHASAIAVDGSGSVYVTGYSADSGTYFHDYATIKYYSNGNTAWVRRYSGSGNGRDWGSAIAIDNSGSVYVTGRSYSGASDDYATIKYIQFLRGDADHDGIVNVSDVVYLVSYLFKRGPVPIPGTIVGDANCDGKVTIADVVCLVAYLFKGGLAPCQ